MGCPFAQLSPLLLLSCLVLFFQFGASFFSPKPLLASLQRGRSLTDAPGGGSSSSSRSRTASPPPHHRGSSSGAGGDGRGGSSGPGVLGAARVLAPAELQVQPDEMDEDLGGEPLPWTESLGSGGPLVYSSLLRCQASALQVELGLERVSVPRRMDTVCNPNRQSRLRSLVYAGDRVRRVRMSYLDTPDMQVYSSIAYSSPDHDFPLLGISAMAMGSRVRVVAVDLQPLFPDAEYAAKYADAYAKLSAIRNKYPNMNQELHTDYFKGSPFFSESMLVARWSLEEEASGYVDNVVMPAVRECVQVYVDVINKGTAHTPGSHTQEAVLERQAEFDRFHAEREPIRPVLTSNFGASFAEKYVSGFVFPYASRNY